MGIMHEIEVSEEKFNAVRSLRELLFKLDKIHFCSWGNFVSAVLFKTSYTGSFDLLVRDESDALDILNDEYEIDMLHGSLVLNETNGAEENASLKIRLHDATSKNEDFRQFLIEHSEERTCVLVSPKGEVEKIEVPIPRRGPVLLLMLIEAKDSQQQIASVIEKIIWSLTNVGVAPLLRESRFVGQSYIAEAADLIEDIFVVRANKTVTLLNASGSSAMKSVTAGDLKKLGRPYAALLRA